MEQNENSLSFDQLPKAVGELLHKVDYVISRLDAPKDANETSDREPEEQMMTLDEACKFIGKKRSTMYSLTSERRIPFRKRIRHVWRRNSAGPRRCSPDVSIYVCPASPMPAIWHAPPHGD